uniref:Uncharacterized protein n=1 Tax=Rhizophora mucronata TaxID=61149 RepID=A0A2P2J322_RHIMU
MEEMDAGTGTVTRVGRIPLLVSVTGDQLEVHQFVGITELCEWISELLN